MPTLRPETRRHNTFPAGRGTLYLKTHDQPLTDVTGQYEFTQSQFQAAVVLLAAGLRTQNCLLCTRGRRVPATRSRGVGKERTTSRASVSTLLNIAGRARFMRDDHGTDGRVASATAGAAASVAGGVAPGTSRTGT